jgi:hypothetical protein
MPEFRVMGFIYDALERYSDIFKIIFVVVKGPPVIAVGFSVARYGLIASASGKAWPV